MTEPPATRTRTPQSKFSGLISYYSLLSLTNVYLGRGSEVAEAAGDTQTEAFRKSIPPSNIPGQGLFCVLCWYWQHLSWKHSSSNSFPIEGVYLPFCTFKHW